MITKALIKSIDFSSNTCVVRIPLFEGSGNINEVTFPATFAITPGIYNSYKTGDIVQVAFENGELNNPVVIGKLYVSANNEKDSYRGAISCDSLNVSSQATLPLETKLSSNPGDKTSVNVKGGYNAIKSLKDIILNIQDLNKQMVSQDIKNDNLYLSKNLNGDYTGLGWNLTDKAWTITSYDSDRKPITLMQVDNSGVTVPNLKVTGYPKETIYRFKQINTTVESEFNEEEDCFLDQETNNTYLKYPKFYKNGDKNGEEITDYNSLTIKDIIDNKWKTLLDLDKNDDYSNIPKFNQNCLIWQISYTTTYSLSEDNELIETLLTDTIKITLLDNGGTGYLVKNSESTGIKNLEENKSKCYYLDKDPNETNDIRLGDCWFNTSKTPIEITITESTENGDETITYTCQGGTLYQWNGEKWENIGGSIVTKNLTAEDVNALNIIAKKIEVKTSENEEEKILFLADGNDNKQEVQIGQFQVKLDENNKQELITQSVENNVKAFTKITAGKLLIQSKNSATGIIGSEVLTNDYYAGISGETLNNNGTLGVFSNKFTMLYPQVNYKDSEDLWANTNLFGAPIPGIVNLNESWGEKNETSTVFDKTNFMLYSIADKKNPTMILILNIQSIWNDTPTLYKIINIKNLKIFENFSLQDSWTNTLYSPQILSGTTTAIDGGNNNISIYIPAGNGFIWHSNPSKPKLHLGEIGITIPYDSNLVSNNSHIRHFSLILYIWYPPYGNEADSETNSETNS